MGPQTQSEGKFAAILRDSSQEIVHRLGVLMLKLRLDRSYTDSWNPQSGGKISVIAKREKTISANRTILSRLMGMGWQRDCLGPEKARSAPLETNLSV